MDFYLIDVFAEQMYQGNQLAVFIPDRDLPDGEMLQIAREVNYSETTFILPPKCENGGYRVRIFTPDREIPFAGHPVIGTAEIINRVYEAGSADKIILNLEVGQIPVVIENQVLTMSQNQPSFDFIVDDLGMVAQALNIDVHDIRTGYPIQQVSTGLPCIVVPLKSLEAIGRCRINHQVFEQFLQTYNKCNLLVFADEENEKSQLRVRVFMDDTGYFEDPATGSASGNLAAYLLKHNYYENSEIRFSINQGVEINRNSKLFITASLKHDLYEIQVGGKASLVASGQWQKNK